MYDIRLKQIECFLTLAQTLSFTTSAKTLGISQPLASKWIKALEDELGTALLIRSKDGISLTNEGKFLYNEWMPAFHGVVSAITRMQAIGDEKSPALRIGILDRYETDPFIHDIIQNFGKDHPSWNIRVSSHGIQELIDRLMGHDLDVVFHTTLDAGTQDGIHFKPLRSVEFFIAISKNHRLAQRKSLTIADLKNESFFSISEDESPSSSRRIISQCQKAGFTPHNMQFVPNLSSLSLSIIYQNGVTVTTAEIAKGYEHMIKLYPIAEYAGSESIALLYRKSDPGENALTFSNSIS